MTPALQAYVERRWGKWPDRFWRKVNKDGPLLHEDLGQCWIWTGALTRGGYGMVRHPETRQMVPAHRMAFELAHGQTVLDICHKCDNPSCVRDSHLFAGTETENIQDALRKDRKGMKLNLRQVKNIRQRIAQGDSNVVIAKEFGVTASNVSSIRIGRIWREEVLSASI